VRRAWVDPPARSWWSVGPAAHRSRLVPRKDSCVTAHVAPCAPLWLGRPEVACHCGARRGFRPELALYVRSQLDASCARHLPWLQRHGIIASWTYEPHRVALSRHLRRPMSYLRALAPSDAQSGPANSSTVIRGPSSTRDAMAFAHTSTRSVERTPGTPMESGVAEIPQGPAATSRLIRPN
jgi:hypothetical protein